MRFTKLNMQILLRNTKNNFKQTFIYYNHKLFSYLITTKLIYRENSLYGIGEKNG